MSKSATAKPAVLATVNKGQTSSTKKDAPVQTPPPIRTTEALIEDLVNETEVNPPAPDEEEETPTPPPQHQPEEEEEPASSPPPKKSPAKKSATGKKAPAAASKDDSDKKKKKSSEDDEAKEHRSRSARAGLIMRLPVVENILRSATPRKTNISESAVIDIACSGEFGLTYIAEQAMGRALREGRPGVDQEIMARTLNNIGIWNMDPFSVAFQNNSHQIMDLYGPIMQNSIGKKTYSGANALQLEKRLLHKYKEKLEAIKPGITNAILAAKKEQRRRSRQGTAEENVEDEEAATQMDGEESADDGKGDGIVEDGDQEAESEEEEKKKKRKKPKAAKKARARASPKTKKTAASKKRKERDEEADQETEEPAPKKAKTSKAKNKA